MAHELDSDPSFRWDDDSILAVRNVGRTVDRHQFKFF
jgi:hypothetical protein